MGQTPSQIVSDIHEARSRLGQDLNELEFRVRRTTDWRAHFDRHPWTILGAAFGAAMVVGMMATRRASS